MTNFWRLRIRLKRSIACSRRRNGRYEFSARLFRRHCHIVKISGNNYRMKEHQNLLRAASEKRTEPAAR